MLIIQIISQKPLLLKQDAKLAFKGYSLQTVKIDEIDARILRMLLRESRTTFTDIANECHITVGAVRMRYKRLWKEGIINGEVMLINPHCLGYRHIIDLGILTQGNDEKDVAAFLDTKPYIGEVVTHQGRYNFFGKAALRDLNQLSKIVEDLESNSKISRVDAMIWAEAINIEYPNNLLIKPIKQVGEQIRRPALTNLDQTPLQLDEIDRKIAITLSRKSRTPFRQIAKELDLSTKTVIQRYNKLRMNLLTCSTITVDLSKLGYKALANFFIKVTNRSKMNDIYSGLLKIPNVIVIIRLIGTYDLYVGIVVEDFKELFETKKLVEQINGLENPDVFMVPVPTSWPLNLFPSLLESDVMHPKYWTDKTNNTYTSTKP
jgi:Lrp/AsnC family transcriptional regulator for asnA, asnC and gidA